METWLQIVLGIYGLSALCLTTVLLMLNGTPRDPRDDELI